VVDALWVVDQSALDGGTHLALFGMEQWQWRDAARSRVAGRRE